MKFIEKLRDTFTDWLTKEVDKPRALSLTDFERIQYELRPCDVLLIEGRARVSRIIQLITQSSWTHSALYIGRLHDVADHSLREKIKQFYQGEPDEQLIIESMLGHGIIVSPLKKYEHDHIRICRPKGISRQDAQKVIGYSIRRLGTHYDIRNVLDLARLLLPWGILPRRWRSTLFTHNPGGSTKETCSSLLAEAFESVDFPILPILKTTTEHGMQLIQRIPRLCTPSDFDYSPFFEIIKYPIIELSEGAAYRNLPWNKEVLSDNEGKLYKPDLSKQPEPEPSPEVIATPLEESTAKKPPPRAMEFFD